MQRFSDEYRRLCFAIISSASNIPMPKFRPIPKNGPFLVRNKPQTSPEVERTLASVAEPVHQSLCNAISKRHQVKFMYQGKPRIVEPHDYGIRNKRARLLTYQLGGQSGSGPLPDWRWFDVSQITNFEVLADTFSGNRPSPPDRHHQWDKLFARVDEANKGVQ